MSGDVMTVLVMDTFAGVWARFTGVDRDGQAVTVDGAVVAGPTDTVRAGRPALAVLVRTHTDRGDVLVFTDLYAEAELAEDDGPAADDPRGLYATGSVFGPVARVEFYNREIPGSAVWAEQAPTAERMAELERRGHEDPDVGIVGVYRSDLHVPADLLT